MKVLFKVIASNKQPINRFISSIGTVIGLVIILISIELYKEFENIIPKQGGVVNENHQVISKKINQLSFLQKEIKGFNESDINLLKSQANIIDIAPFKSCNYQVMISVGNQSNGIPGFYTLAFFESIPERFLEDSYDFSSWDISKNEIPVILPKNYLDAYNYGLALSMNTPQISEEFIKKLRFNIEVSGNNKKAEFIGKVVGLSKKINSILVPEQFLQTTNEIYGNKKTENYSRVIVTNKNPNDDLYIDFLNKNHYSTNDNSQKSSLIQKLLNGLFSYQIIIALIIIAQGLLLLLFYTRIIIQSSDKEIKKLFIIGYGLHSIIRVYEKKIFKLYGIVFLTSLVVTFIIKFLITKEIVKIIDLELSFQLNELTYIIWGILIVVFFFINRINLNHKLNKLLSHLHL